MRFRPAAPARGNTWRARLEKPETRRPERSSGCAALKSLRMPWKERLARGVSEILLVDDSAGDIRLMQEAFREAGCTARLNVARNGLQALAYLRKEAPFQTSERPALILLDLNLPGASGSELLAEIKKERSLRQIPVIVLSTSADAGQIAAAYDLHANCYITKPATLESLVDVVRVLEAFWLGTVALAPPDVSSRPLMLACRKSA